MNQSQSLALQESFEALEGLYRVLDHAKDEIEATTGLPTCVENCGRCCQAHVPAVTAIESEYVISVLGVKKDFRKVVDASLNWMEEQVPHQAEGYKEQVDEVMNTRCPFLDEHNGCIIHEARPMICRAYSITALPDEWCQRPLSPIETLKQRVLLGKDTEGGRLVRMLQDLVLQRAKKADKRESSFLPFYIAKEMAAKEVLDLVDEGHVDPAKMATGERSLDFFAGDRQETVAKLEGQINERAARFLDLKLPGEY